MSTSQHPPWTGIGITEIDPTRKLSTVKEIYTSLPLTENQFRLLFIRRLSEKGCLECELFQVDDVTVEGLPYCAISYTWGGQPIDHALLCNGIEVPVTRSCLDVLSTFYNSNAKFVAWIDQLCIDQDNGEEKSEQILLMSRIYAGAGMVISWIDRFENLTSGLNLSDSETTSTIMQSEITSNAVVESRSLEDQIKDIDATKALIEHLASCWFAHEHDHGLVEAESVAKTPTSLRAWDHVLGIFRHPYFERRWIIQESIAKNRSIVLFSHDRSLMWLKIYGCARMLMMIKEGRANEFHSVIRGRVLNKLRLLDDKTLCIIMTIQIRARKVQQNNMDLLELLEKCKRFKNFDERDRVYALRGLASDAHVLKPNYSLSASELLLRIARYHIRRGDGVKILTNAGLAFRTSDTTVPSWVPTWEAAETVPFSAHPGNVPNYSQNSGLAASGTTELKLQVVGPDDKVLISDGSLIGRIRTTSPQYRFPYGEDFTKHVRDFVPPSRRLSVEQYLKFILQFAGPNRARKLDRSIGERLELSLQVMLVPEGMSLDEPVRKAFSVATTNAFADLGSDVLVTGRRSCVTDQGNVGLVPTAALPGDWVAILDGINVAMIVREGQEPDRGLFQLVGDAYFLGLARGEALRLDAWKNWRRVFAFG